MRVLDKILKFFHLTKSSNYNELLDQYNTLNDSNHKNMEILCKLQNLTNDQQALNDRMVEHINELIKRISSVTFKTMEKYKAENEALREDHNKIIKDLEDGIKYYNSVQKQVSEMMHNSQEWSFPNSMCFPGATIISSGKTSCDNIENSAGQFVYKGRTVLTDDITTKLQNTASINEKMNIIILQLKKQGIYDKIMKDLIAANPIRYTIGYNTDCTCYEVYYCISVNIPDTVLNIE